MNAVCGEILTLDWLFRCRPGMQDVQDVSQDTIAICQHDGSKTLNVMKLVIEQFGLKLWRLNPILTL